MNKFCKMYLLVQQGRRKTTD